MNLKRQTKGKGKKETDLLSRREESDHLEIKVFVSIVKSEIRCSLRTSDGEDDAVDESAKTRSDSVRQFTYSFDDLRCRITLVSPVRVIERRDLRTCTSPGWIDGEREMQISPSK